MGEKIVSPGVFTREKDLSFLPQGIADIGACVIGSTRKGPAFVPTLVDSMADFEVKFGAVWEDSYLPYTVQQYMKSAGLVTIVRVLGERGYANYKQLGFKLGQTTAATTATGSWTFTAVAHNDVWTVNARNGTAYDFTADVAPTSSDDTANYNYYFLSASGGGDAAADLSESIESFRDKVNSVKAGLGIGTIAYDNTTTLQVTASAGGIGGNLISAESASVVISTLGGGANAVGGEIVAVSAPVRGYATSPLYDDNTAANQVQFSAGSTLAEGSTGTATTLTLTEAGTHEFSVNGAPASATHYYSASFDYTETNSLGALFGRDIDGNQPIYLYSWFKNAAKALVTANSGISASIEEVNLDFLSTDGKKKYSEAYTPTILSQTTASLFKVATLAHGSNANDELKIAISNIKWPGAVPGSDYGSFNLVVRRYGDTDLKPEILEQFNNVSLDPDSPNYFPRAIGDRYVTIDAAGKLSMNGDWGNKSKYIRVDNYKPAAPLVDHVPWGFAPYTVPFDGEDSSTTAIPTASYTSLQESDDQYNSRVHFGVDFDNNSDNLEYNSPIGVISDDDGGSDTGSNVAFTLNGVVSDGTTLVYGVAASCSLASRQFIVGFQGGFDGFAPMRPVQTAGDIGAYTQGWYLSTVESDTDYASFKKAINAVSNPDEFDINMLVIPGVDSHYHSPVTTYAKNMCEDRGDTFYIMDLRPYGSPIADATETSGLQDTNYAAVYYPWVRILDTSTGKLVWVPPSVVMAGVIAFTDKVSHEWFAPAGLLRGGLSDVLEAETRLTHDERDELYEERVNPIATFPGQGVVVWGQKTLQGKPSALDRVNVRRLLIKLKKFIASSTKFLVFEQNTAATRNRFLNIVNPFLEQVQQNSGLSAFKVVMDDTNNTPDLIDRNILFGQIYIQPTRTAEFIILDFNIMPTGATFPE